MKANTSNQFYNDIVRVLPLAERSSIAVISPHIDDAVWSLGPVLKTLAEHDHKLRLINLFSNTVIVGDDVSSPAESTAVRKSEEAQVAQEVGFEEVLYLDFPDGILRDRELSTIFDPNYETPKWLVETLLAVLKKHIPADALVLAPSGFGWHIDHQLAAYVATQLPNEVIFYEDFPYAARTVRIEEAQKFLRQQNTREERIKVTPEVIDQHLHLYRLYAAQRASHHEEQISAYLASEGYGLWRREP